MRRRSQITAFLLTLAFTLSAHAHPLTSALEAKSAPRGVKIEIGDLGLFDLSNCLPLKGKTTPGTTIASGQLFTGEQFDPNVGFYYLRARYYNPANGRFPTMDPFGGLIGVPVTLHKYLYVANDPVLNIDPSGLLTLRELQAGINHVGRTTRAAARAFSKGKSRLGGKLMNRAGEQAEKLMSRIIKECLQPKKQIDGKIPTGVPGSKRSLDHLAEFENLILKIETKNKLPIDTKPLKRMRNQLSESVENLAPNEVLVGVGVTPRASDRRLENAIKRLTDFNASSNEVLLFNGALDFLMWAGEQFGEFCL